MSKMVKIFILIAFLTPLIILTCSFHPTGVSYVPNNQIYQAYTFDSLNYERNNYTGKYQGNVSVMCTWDENDYTWWSDDNNCTIWVPNNATPKGYVYNLNYIDVWAYHIYDSYDFILFASNLTAETNVTESIAFAQEFTSPNLTSIDEIYLYLNYSIPFPIPLGYWLEVYIYNESLQEIIDYNKTWEYRADINGWYLFKFYNNILEPGIKYNIVFKVWFYSENDYKEINYWKADESTNNGTTRFFNETQWDEIENDSTTDFLCAFGYWLIIDPAEIDLKFIINDTTFIPEYRPSFWAWGYEASLRYNFEEPPTHEINVTVITNQSIPIMIADVFIYYVYLINSSGTFNTNENRIEWIIKYPYVDISGSGQEEWDFFLFEYDWTLINFYDPDNNTNEELFIGTVDLYNETYYGLCQIWQIPFEEDIYTGIYHSPNYCSGITTLVKNESNYLEVVSFELGQTIKIEVEIMNSNNEPVSGGVGHIEMLSPTGGIIFNETGLNSTNGIMNCSDYILETNLSPGTYYINIFWTNGKEVAYYSTSIEVKRKLFPPILLPSTGLTTEMMILIGLLIAIAAVTTPVALYTRKKLQERNWEKACRNLFVLEKNSGVSMYFYSFGIEIQDPALISGMISALTAFVKEATGSKRMLQSIDQEDKKLLLYHGQYTIVALIADKNLSIIRKHLEKFARDFEKTYEVRLFKWDGDTSIFKTAEKIIYKYFPVEMEEKIIRGVRQKLIEFRERLSTAADPVDVISIFREITEFSTKYQKLINRYYAEDYNELIKIADEKSS